MKKIRSLITLILSLSLVSCMTFEEKASDQHYPDFKVPLIEETVMTDYQTDSIYKLKDIRQIGNLQQFLRDSTNYFTSDLITFNGQKSTHRLDLIRESDTLTLFLHPTSELDKLEVGYFDPEDLKIHDQYKEFRRFYIHRNILDLVNKSE